MKKFIIIYTIISVILLVFVTAFSAYNQYLARMIDVFNMITEEAVETRDLDTFIAYQSKAYELVQSEISGDYEFFVYRSLGEDSEGDFEQLSIYVMPLNDVTYATDVDDDQDQSDIVFKNDQGSIIYQLSDDENYEGEAISYGIEQIGFYYAAIRLDAFMHINVEVYDYDHQDIYQTAYDYNSIFNIQDEGVSPGMTEEELNGYIDFNTYVRPEILNTVMIFIVVDIIVGSALYFYRKKSKKL